MASFPRQIQPNHLLFFKKHTPYASLLILIKFPFFPVPLGNSLTPQGNIIESPCPVPFSEAAGLAGFRTINHLGRCRHIALWKGGEISFSIIRIASPGITVVNENRRHQYHDRGSNLLRISPETLYTSFLCFSEMSALEKTGHRQNYNWYRRTQRVSQVSRENKSC